MLLLTAFLFPAGTYAQAPNDDALVKMLDRQNYTFNPGFIVTLLNHKQLIANPVQYFLRVTPDSIICFLPTPKRRYRQGAMPVKADSRPDFSKISFEERFALKTYSYKILETAKNERQIQLVPKTKGRIQQVRLNVLPGGHATLSIGAADYAPITYGGYLAANAAGKRR